MPHPFQRPMPLRRSLTPLVVWIALAAIVLAVPASGSLATAVPQTVPITAPDFALNARSGYGSVQLIWQPLGDPRVDRYRIDRLASDGLERAPVVETAATSFVDRSVELAGLDGGCYAVVALDRAGASLGGSAPACAPIGLVQLWTPEIQAAPGSEIEVPISARDVSGLRLLESALWLDYDPAVLRLEAARPGALVQGGYALNLDATTAGQARLRLTTTASPALYGDGAVAWLRFQVIGDVGSESPLNIRLPQGDLAGTLLASVFDPTAALPVSTSDGRLRVLEAALTSGDLDGNGAIQLADVDLMLEIATGTRPATEAERSAGDLNGDSTVNAADATLLLARLRLGRWPNIGDPGAPASAVDAQPQLSLGFAPNTGGEVSVTIHAQQLTDWAGGTIVLAYDPTTVTGFSSVGVIGIASDMRLRLHDDGAGLLTIALAGGAAVSGAGPLVRLIPQIAEPGLTLGISNISIGGAQLNDLAGRDHVRSALQQTIFVQRLQGVYLPLLAR